MAAATRISCGSRSSNPATWSLCVLITVLSLALPIYGQGRGQGRGCGADLSSKVSQFQTTSLVCQPVRFPGPTDFNVWALKDNVTLVTSMVVAAPLSATTWIAIGFSASGLMTGSTALITTLNSSKGGVVTEYSLNGRTTSQVVKSTGALDFVGGLPEGLFDSASGMVYVSFQVNLERSAAKSSFLLFAYGGLAPDGSISRHTEKTQIPATIATGVVPPRSRAAALDKKGKIHGSLMILGWGLILPIGILIARFARAWDPTWFYLHASFQLVGFVCIIAGVALGIQLAKDLQPQGLAIHRGLGLFVFALAVLQVLAVFWRPKKDTKVRKYWLWYHRLVGSLATALAIGNIFLGLNMAHSEQSFRVGAVSVLAIVLAAFIILEINQFWRLSRHRRAQQSSNDQQGFQFGGSV